MSASRKTPGPVARKKARTPNKGERHESDLVLNAQRELAAEVFRIINHEQAVAILMNDWVQNGSLPIPSERFILYFAAQSLGNPYWMELDNCTSFEEAVERIVSSARADDENQHLVYVQTWWPHMEAAAVMGTAAQWTEILRAFNLCHLEQKVEHQVGQRALARRLIESLVLRAIFFQDTHSLRSLAESIDLSKAGENPPCLQPNRIASEILVWQSRVRSELGDDVPKETLKAFICEMSPWLSRATSKVWAKAWRIARWASPTKDRRGKREKSLGIELAKRLKSNW